MPTNYEIEFLLNPVNKEITEDIINNIFNKYKINFQVNNDIDIFIQGLTHESFSIKSDNYEDLKQEFSRSHKNMVFVKNYNYERLEFLGDAIIKPIISIYLVERYPYENEGFLSTLRTKIESTNTLSHFFKSLGLQDYILLSQTIEQENGRNNIHILEDCFEAFIGALFKYSQLNGISYGDIMNIIQKLVNVLIETELNLSELIQMKDYKGALNEYCHKEKIQLPKYVKNNISSHLQSYEGKYANEKEIYMYNVSVIVDGITYGPASDIILKEAEQKVAKIALEALNNEDNDDDIYILKDDTKEQDLLPKLNVFKPIDFKSVNKQNNQDINKLNLYQENKPKKQFNNQRNNKKYKIKQPNQQNYNSEYNASKSLPIYLNNNTNKQNRYSLQNSPNNSPNHFKNIHSRMNNKHNNSFNKGYNKVNCKKQNNELNKNFNSNSEHNSDNDSDDIFIVK